jgi:hypothetical protein
MVALRALVDADEDLHEPRAPRATDPADWLTLEQAACELGISVSTVRRRIRKGELRNRIVPRRGGFSYRIYVPGARHGRDPGLHGHPDPSGRIDLEPGNVVSLDVWRARGAAPAEADAGPPSQAQEVRRLEQQVEKLSAALATALRTKQRTPPPRHPRKINREDPYARYRSLVRKRRWWQF